MRCSIKHYPALKPVKILFLKIYDVQGKIRKAWDIIHYCSINKSRFINLYQQLVLTNMVIEFHNHDMFTVFVWSLFVLHTGKLKMHIR